MFEIEEVLMTTTLVTSIPNRQRVMPCAAAHARLVPLAPGRWRVVDRRGLIIGHVQLVPEPRGERYRARRYRPSARALTDVGDFWSAEEAVQCLCAGR